MDKYILIFNRFLKKLKHLLKLIISEEQILRLDMISIWEISRKQQVIEGITVLADDLIRKYRFRKYVGIIIIPGEGSCYF